MLRTRAAGLLGIGASIAVWLVGSALLGRWLDGKWGTDPAFTVVLMLVGLAIGLYDAYRRLKELVASTDKNGN